MSSRTRLALPLLLVSVAVLAPACADRSASPPGPGPAAAAPTGDATTRAVRRTREVWLGAADPRAALSSIRSEASARGAVIASAEASGADDEARAELVVHVPSAEAAAFTAAITHLGRVERETERAEDVTDQKADLGARLRNARAQEERLLALLGDRAGTLADVIALEKELAGVRESVERLAAQEDALAAQITRETFTIHVSSHDEPVGALARIERAGVTGTRAAGQVAMAGALTAAHVGPTLLLLAALGGAAWLLARSIVARLVSATGRRAER